MGTVVTDAAEMRPDATPVTTTGMERGGVTTVSGPWPSCEVGRAAAAADPSSCSDDDTTSPSDTSP